MVPLQIGQSVSMFGSGQARVFDLRRNKASRRCQGFSTGLRCSKLASAHELTSRWFQMRKEAAETAAQAATKASDTSLLVHVRAAKRIAPILLFANEAGEVPVAAAITAFALREAAARIWPQCALCQRLQSCSVHLPQLREELLPAALPPLTCRLQLWAGFERLRSDEDLRNYRDPLRGRVDLVAKADPKSLHCQGTECQRCASLADAEPVSAALRRRRHFWRCKRPAFLLRFGQTVEQLAPLVAFFRRSCPETTFHLIVTFL